MATGLDEILTLCLDGLGLKAEVVGYTRPLLPAIEDSKVPINGLGIVNRSVIDICHYLEMMGRIGTGIDNVDVNYCTSRSIWVANIPQANSIVIAEHRLSL